MTDKQIIEKLKTDLDFERSKRKTLQAEIKAKEQECERLKEERDTWHFQWEKRYEICESLSDDIDKLCEQLDQLKEQLEAYKMEAEEGKEINAELKAENDLFRTCHDNEQTKRRKCEQTLTEIKEIAEICCKTTDCKKCKFFEICENNCVDVILQKISEVEDD